MLLSLIRDTFTSDCTLGILFVDGEPFCGTLEPPIVSNALHPKGAVPAGWYRLSLTWSPKFQRVLPLLHCVPGFAGIRLHAGNRKEDTQGCLLVGVRSGCSLQLADSCQTEKRLVELLQREDDAREELYIEVTDVERYAVERLQGPAAYSYELH